MKKATDGLTGRGLLQSREEWEARNNILAASLLRLAQKHCSPVAQRGLDVGCQTGDLTDYMNAHSTMSWEGVDPALPGPTQSPQGATLYSASADTLPYPDSHFDCLIFANVFEHIPPDRRDPSLREMYRVMRPGAILVGQLPNPYFPLESHSRLPFTGWLPLNLQKKYWRLSPVPWEHDFYTVTVRHLRRSARRAGLELVQTSNFNYPSEALPRAARLIAAVLKAPMQLFPWAWQFTFRRPEV